MRPISNEKREIIIEGKKRGENEKNNPKLGKRHQPKLHHQNMETIPKKQETTNPNPTPKSKAN